MTALKTPALTDISTTSPLRILHLADSVYEEMPGGSRQVARELMREQTLAGHEVTILVGRQISGSAREWKDAHCGRVVQYEKGDSPKEWIGNGRAACQRLIESANAAGEPFDIVHSHFAYAAIGPLQAIGKRSDGKSAIPHVRTFHGPWDAEGWIEDSCGAGFNPIRWLRALAKRQARYRIERDVLRASDSITTLSSVFANSLDRYGIATDHIAVIPGGVNRERFRVDVDDARARSSARALLGLPQDAFPLLLSVRRLSSRMGLDNLITAFAAIHAQLPQAHLVLGGSGPLRPHLEARIAALGLQQHVQLTGFIAEERLADYYRAADLFVLPTTALEGFGLVIVEALGCGTPVVATPIGGIPEVLGGLDPRLIASSAEPDAITKSVLGFCEARTQRGGWAAELTPKRLADFVDGRFTWLRHAEAIDDLYRRTIKHSTFSP